MKKYIVETVKGDFEVKARNALEARDTIEIEQTWKVYRVYEKGSVSRGSYSPRVPMKAERHRSFLGNAVDCDVYSTGGPTHWVDVSHIESGAHQVRRFNNRAEAVRFARGEAA